MKTILAPTDYSTTARDATEYAIELAKVAGSRVLLFHALTVPIATMEIHGPLLYNIGDLEKENQKIIKSLTNEIIRKNPGLTVDSLLSIGFPVEEIISTAKEKRVDLIVMGLKGMSKAEELIIGSNTSSVAKEANCPVLVVPDGVKFKEPRNIVIACDYNKDFEDENVWQQVKEFARTFDSKLYVLDVLNKDEISVDKAATGLKVARFLKDIPHTLHFQEGDDLVESISTFVKQTNADMLVMLPGKYNLIERLFHKSTTRKVIFNSEIPVLTLHAE